MNSVFEKYKWLKYVLGAFIIVVGVVVIILACLVPDKTSTITDIILATGLILLGLFLFINSIFFESHKGFTSTFIIAAAMITGGIAILVGKFGIGISLSGQFLVDVISITALVVGVLSLVKGVSLIIYKEKGGLIFLAMLVSVAGIVSGILGLCFAPKLVTASYILMGIVLIAGGILFIVFTIINNKKKGE